VVDVKSDSKKPYVRAVNNGLRSLLCLILCKEILVL